MSKVKRLFDAEFWNGAPCFKKNKNKKRPTLENHMGGTLASKVKEELKFGPILSQAVSPQTYNFVELV